ncbi:nucleotidyltransferase AbiEii toxin of type IV toxin-antitoxin system [Micromonospora pisi]|uniref:Nucleotidyltransferase AbiEii toxin of type IV toxin-antitoxin system n=2 Tax=Micromonospora pisi TaxID=589240 RepID=A0A495JDM6_9ACTN|nr:nucleotidyltransferase AbiEii toxin of type IV toxin-antitoxin system [Micromonospora pisi]
MAGITGDFEIDVTVGAGDADPLAGFAEDNGLKYTHVVLDRGLAPSQPMLTLAGAGSLDRQRGVAQRWSERLEQAGLRVVRSRIRAASWCEGVPATDEEAAAQPSGRYFEHRLRLLLPPGVATLLAVTELAERHGARLSRDAQRTRTDGLDERFVTQRCRNAGRATAQAHLDQLVGTLRGHGWQVVAAEQTYVVFDDCSRLDAEWLVRTEQAGQGGWEDRMRRAPAGTPDYPRTYLPLPDNPGLRQRAAFDPALKQRPNAYRAGEPEFADPVVGQRWTTARRTAMTHLLNVINRTRWAEHLVLRGSVTLSAWLGDAAREPGDLDFVVTPFALSINSPEAREMLDGVVSALRGHPGAGLDPDRVQVEDIWTYERADGRRLAVPFTAAHDLTGSVQLDFVFNEHLPMEPTTIRIDGVGEAMRAAPPALSLAWKLMWLGTDMYPQGKDLYDAVLLAEYTTVDLRLVRDLLRPELGAEADTFTAETVLRWDVDWRNFTDEYPGVTGDVDAWKHRLALALDRPAGALL